MSRSPSWDPALYRRFAGERLRPGVDLLARVPLDRAASIVDLGCGTGELTEIIAVRFPMADVIGLDYSPAMLAEAAGRGHGRIRWREGDIATFAPENPTDLLYANAALQWLDHHERLFPRLLAALTSGGVLAVQMPRNYEAPSHRLMHEVAGLPRFRDRLAGRLRRDPVGAPEIYYALLAPVASGLDIWESLYLHVLDGEDAVFHWVKGTGLRPLLDTFGAETGEREAFIAAYKSRLDEAYPRRADGKTLLEFRRLFIVAQR